MTYLSQGPVAAVYVVGWVALAAAIAALGHSIGPLIVATFGMPKGTEIGFFALFFGIAFVLPVVLMNMAALSSALLGWP